jgi:hypothetical protein
VIENNSKERREWKEVSRDDKIHFLSQEGTDILHLQTFSGHIRSFFSFGGETELWKINNLKFYEVDCWICGWEKI